MNNIYRYSLERYRGRGRKYAFTRYIDNTNNQYVADNVGKCNRLDKCGYHYTPRQYFEDHPWLNDGVELLNDIGKFNKSTATHKPTPPPVPKLPRGQCPRLSHILPYPLFIHNAILSHFMDTRKLNAVEYPHYI